MVTGLWTGRPFAYHRAHYHVEETVFLPPPRQSARIPIRVAAFWPNRAPFRRAARWDGVCVGKMHGRITASELRISVAYLSALGSARGTRCGPGFGWGRRGCERGANQRGRDGNPDGAATNSR